MSTDNALQSPDEHRFLFSKRTRRLLIYAGLFVLYSQIVSAGLTGVYRYSPWEKTWFDGGDPPIFDTWTLTAIQPAEGIGTAADWLEVGRDYRYPAYRTLLWAIIAPALGSAALVYAGVAGIGWRPRCLLILGSAAGILAALAIKAHEWAYGSIGWAVLSTRITDRTLPHAPHPIYGYAELIGGFFLPILIYAALVLFIAGWVWWRLSRYLWQAVRTRRN